MADKILIDHTTFGLMGPIAHTATRAMPVHCVIFQIGERVILLDAGFGTREMLAPNSLLGDDALFKLGHLIDPRLTAYERSKSRGIRPEQVTDIILTHMDNDHVGGVHDFPDAIVHVSSEELEAYDSAQPRGPYKPYQISHDTKFKTYERTGERWFDLEVRQLPGDLEAKLVPLPGHTFGHCGVAYCEDGRWSLHATGPTSGIGRATALELAKHATTAATAAAIAALALASCGSRNTYIAPPPPKVLVTQPLQKPVTLYVYLTGNTAPFRTANLVARVQGYLESIDYEDGAAVTKGTQLFLIERDTYQAQVDLSKAQLAKDQAVLAEVQLDLKRYQSLVQQKSIAAQQAEDQAFVVEQDKATVGVDQANLDTANINLGYTKVLAPFDGVMSNHQVDIGNLVGGATATTLATIMQTDPLYVNFTLSEPQVLAIRRSVAKKGVPLNRKELTYIQAIPVEIGLQDEEGYPHKGHLDYVSPQVDSSTGAVSLRAVFENKDSALLPGLFVRVRAPIGYLEGALLTRDDAIGTSQEGSYVLVVGADNVVERKIVKTGQKQGQLRIIESGLDPGDWVVTEGVQQAFAGAKVEPQRSELKSVGIDLDDAKTSVPAPTPK